MKMTSDMNEVSCLSAYGRNLYRLLRECFASCEACIFLPCGLQRYRFHAGKECCLQRFAKWTPVAADDAVVCYNGIEDARVVVRKMAMCGVKHQVAALVTNQIFVVGWNEQAFAVAVSVCTATVEDIECAFAKMLGVQLVAEQCHASLAVALVHPRPPDEVFERCGLMALEVLPCQQCKALFASQRL